MSVRELVVLGTASQAPTRDRNHNGYLLRWDGEGLLFDPGEGTQRQLTHAGVASSDITRICITHFHGDHCLGVPGVVQRLSLDRVPHRVVAHYPASGHEYFARLRYATAFHEAAPIAEEPVTGDGIVVTGGFGVLTARRLDHPVDTFGYRLVEPDGRRMLPGRLAERGVTGPDVGLAERYGHLTAAQAARVAAECGVRRLVLTHFSQRYTDPAAYAAEAAAHFDGDTVVAEDLCRVPVPPRR